MILVHTVVVLALLQYLIFGGLVAGARGKYGVHAPATTGNAHFERYYRVQVNTLELLVIFLPSLWLAAQYWSPLWMGAIGAVYLVGRQVYLRAYVRDPGSRTLGYALSMLPTLALMLAVIAGIVVTLVK